MDKIYERVLLSSRMYGQTIAAMTQKVIYYQAIYALHS
jgi:hypothetical protein